MFGWDTTGFFRYTHPEHPVASLFVLQFGANTGYAIAPLEKLFFEAGLELAEGNPALIHLGYPDYDRGRPAPHPKPSRAQFAITPSP